MKNINNKKKGFTLIEMIVSLGLFTVVITISLGSFLNLSVIQRKIDSLRSVNDNFNFALEFITREIRTGRNYGAGGNSFSFTNFGGDNIVYTLSGGAIEREVNGGGALALTAPQVSITNLYFEVRGEAPGDQLQPMVQITMNGFAGTKETEKALLNLEAVVSQRELDS